MTQNNKRANIIDGAGDQTHSGVITDRQAAQLTDQDLEILDFMARTAPHFYELDSELQKSGHLGAQKLLLDKYYDEKETNTQRYHGRK